MRVSSVTQAIIYACVAVFLAHLFASRAIDHWLGLSLTGLQQGRVWQVLSYMFVHADPFHILFNLLALWFLGREVEYFIGAKSFAGLYLVSGLIGGLVWLAFNPVGLLVGASAGVLGCVVAFAALFPERELTLLLFFIIPVRLKAKHLAIGIVVLEVLFELSGTQRGVAHLAHLGGASVGYVFIKLLGFGTRPRWALRLQRFRLPNRPRPGCTSPTVEDYLREEIDPILDKISREGMHSLTRQERKTLESARDLMEKHRR